jgi:metal-responsive CopG/Arc/MetJ family transcriptional regulator
MQERKVLTFVATEALVHVLDHLSERTSLSRSEVIRTLLIRGAGELYTNIERTTLTLDEAIEEMHSAVLHMKKKAEKSG